MASPFNPDEVIKDEYFINESERNAADPSQDEGKLPQLEDDGSLSHLFFRYSFGDGSDGDVTISTETSLSRDMYYENLTVNSTLVTNGYRIFVRGTLSGTGTIKYPDPNNGANAGSNGSRGSGGNAYTAGGFLSNTGGGDGAQGTFQDTIGAGNGPNGYIGAEGAAGGAAGSAGNGNSPSGAGGAGLANLAKQKYAIERFSTLQFIEHGFDAIKTLTLPGSGGGARGGNSAGGSGHSGGGGGAGASGGPILVVVKRLSGTVDFLSTGGDGGDGGDAPGGDNGGGGGGAGGSGGVVVIIYFDKEDWNGAYILSPGIGGALGQGAGSGNDGSPGEDGLNGVSMEVFIGDLL